MAMPAPVTWAASIRCDTVASTSAVVTVLPSRRWIVAPGLELGGSAWVADKGSPVRSAAQTTPPRIRANRAVVENFIWKIRYDNAGRFHKLPPYDHCCIPSPSRESNGGIVDSQRRLMKIGITCYPTYGGSGV